MEDLPVIGIYCITERATGKRYVGQSRNVHARWWQHRGRFPVETHDYEILAECGAEELDDLEQSFITQLNTQWPNGFNKTKGGQSWDMVWTPEMLEAVSLKRKDNWADPEKRAKYVEARVKRWSDPEQREAASIRSAEVGSRPEVKESLSKRVSQSWQDPEIRQRHIEGRLRRWSDQESREEQSSKLTWHWSSLSPQEREQRCRNVSEAQTPEVRAKKSAALKGRPKPTVECPECGSHVAVTIAKRWHFDKCKRRNHADQ